MHKQSWVTRDLNDPYGQGIRCNFHTRLVILGERTPSGQPYDFQPGEVKDDVMQVDIDYLLSLTYQQTSCCGGSPAIAIHYFELV